MADTPRHRFIARGRRPVEDRRFITGQGRFVADIQRPGALHVALVACPHPAARILTIDRRAALATGGVHAVLTGEELAAATEPLANALDTPGVECYPLAVGTARYAGEWVAAVVADSRAIAEDAAELVAVEYDPLPFVTDAEAAMAPGAPLVHPGHGTNILYQRRFTWGPVGEDFARTPHSLSFRARWGRSASVPVETFGVLAEWDEGNRILDVWASIQMPSFAEQLSAALRLPGNRVRVHYDVDVGGSYGVKRGIKHTVLVAHLARLMGRPVRLIEDRLENMTGGDMHGPERIFDVSVAFTGEGRIRAMTLRAIEDVGGQAGRAPLQLGKPVGAITGPYRINSVAYEAICVATNKTGQAAVRGFGQSPTNFAIEAAIDRVARRIGLDRAEIRRRNLIAAGQFPYTIPSGSTYDSGDYHAVLDKALTLATYPDLVRRRNAARAQGRLTGIGIATCLEPSGGNSAFEPLLNPGNQTTTWPESCAIKVDRAGAVTAMISTPTAGQGHQTLVATVIGEELAIEPELIRVVHLDTLTALPGNTPVASRMAIMLGGAAAGAAREIRRQALEIAAHGLGRPAGDLRLADGRAFARDDPGLAMGWAEIAMIAHRQHHRMPAGQAPGLQAVHVWQVPGGGGLPTPDGRVQMYPCYSFAAHIVLAEIDRLTGQVHLPGYWLVHDCGTQINPAIVKGMVLGGTAHGIGAALMEEFAYGSDGQLLSGSLVDYVMPSAHDIPDIRLGEHCTPSPLTSHGQKGVGEGGYLGAPAAVAAAVNDALAPLGLDCLTLPMTPMRLGELIATIDPEPGP